MNETLLKIQNRMSKELTVATEIACLLVAKPLQQIDKEPDWFNCINISTPYEDRDLDVELELKPILGNVIGKLAHVNRKPLELAIAILNREGMKIWVLFVKTEDRAS